MEANTGAEVQTLISPSEKRTEPSSPPTQGQMDACCDLPRTERFLQGGKDIMET